jgi:uncharacterized protein involved in exopolysaccharide biosynthesis
MVLENYLMNAPVEYKHEAVEEQETSLSDYLSILGRRKKAFLLTLGAITALAIGIAASLPPVYRSSATILIKQQAVANELLNTAVEEDPGERLEILIRGVMTKPNLLRIVEKYNLFSDYRDDVSEGAILRKVQKGIGVKMLNPELAGAKNRASRSIGTAFEVSFEYEHNPDVAQQVTNELTRLFLEKNTEGRKKHSAKTVAFLISEAKKIEKKLGKISSEFTVFKKKNSRLLPQQMEFLTSERERTDRELLTVIQEIRSIRASNIQLRGQLAGTKAYIYEDRTEIRNTSGEKVLSATGRLQTLQQKYHSLVAKYSEAHPSVRKVKKEIESLGGNVQAASASPLVTDNLEIAEVELAEARQKYSGGHPSIRQLEAKVARLRKEAVASGSIASNSREFNTLKRINPAFSSLKAGVSSGEAELQSLYDRRDSLQAKLDDFAKRMEGAPGIEQEYNGYSRRYEAALKQYRDLTDKLSKAQRKEAFENDEQGDQFALLEPPEMPMGPVKPNRPAIVMLGALLGLGVAFGLAMLLESLDNSITGRRALVAITGMQPIGTIPIILSKTEAESIQKQKMTQLLLYLGGLGGLLALIAWVHFSYMPLNEVWALISRKIELMMF